MTTTPFLPLDQLFLSARGEQTPVAVRGLEEYNFSNFKTAVSRLAESVAQKGGGDWLIIYEDGWELAVAIFAVLHAGGRPVLPANHQDGHLAEIAAGVDGVIGRELPGRTCLSLSGGRSGHVLGSFDPNVAEIILHTSGSSGNPEAFVKPFHCLQAEVATLHATFSELSSYTILATVPAYHIYGLLFRILWPLAAGWVFDADMIRYPEEVPSRLSVHENCFLVSSPAFLKRAVAVMDWQSLQRLKGVFSSGGPLAPDVAAVYNARLLHPLREVYGSTETGGIGHRAVYDAGVATYWAPLEGVELSLSDDGRLRVASPHITAGVFQTEDLADMRDDGNFLLKGRADRILKIEERRISLSEIEMRLKSMEEIEEVKCVPLQRNLRVTIGVLVVPSALGWKKLRDVGKRDWVKNLRATLGQHISSVGLPRKWRFVGQLPENAQGKITEAAAQAMFERVSTDPNILSEDVTGQTARLHLEISADQIWFDGHFDIAPVLPGVAQVTWAECAARRLFVLGGDFERLEVIKFFEIISPNTKLHLDLSYEPEKSRVLFRYWSEDAEHSKGRIVFARGDDG